MGHDRVSSASGGGGWGDEPWRASRCAAKGERARATPRSGQLFQPPHGDMHETKPHHKSDTTLGIKCQKGFRNYGDRKCVAWVRLGSVKGL